MAVANPPLPPKDPTTEIIEHSIRTLLWAPRERPLRLKLRITASEGLITSVRAVDEDEILDQAKNRGVVSLVKRARDARQVREACDNARRYFFELQGRDTSSDWWKEGIREAVGGPEKKRRKRRGKSRYRRKGKLARVGLPPDPWRDFKIQSLKLFAEIVSWI